MNNYKNSETPAAPTTPVSNNFGQTIMYLGFSKREVLAMELFIKYKGLHGIYENDEDNNNKVIADCYNQADAFLNFEAPESKTDIISLT
jgi:hypothetical protein